MMMSQVTHQLHPEEAAEMPLEVHPQVSNYIEKQMIRNLKLAIVYW